MQTDVQSAQIRRIATVRRVDAIFQAMASDFLLREQFVTDPSQILAEYVFGASIPHDEAATSNQLIYATLADAGMRRWLQDYCSRRRSQMPSTGHFVRDYASAVASSNAHHVVHALIGTAAAGTRFGGLHEDLLHWLLTFTTAAGHVIEGVGGGGGRGGSSGGDGGDGGGGDGGTGTGDGGTGTGDGGTGTGDGGTGTGDGGTGTGDGGTGTGDGGTGTGDGGTGTGDGGTGTGDGGTGTGDGGTGTGDGGTGTGDGGTGTMTAITWTTYITTGDGGTRTGTGPFTQTGGGTRSPFTENRTGPFDDGFAPPHVLVTLNALARYAIGLARTGALGPGAPG